MRFSYVVSIAAHLFVLLASVLLFRARKSMPLLIMMVGSALVFAVEALSLAAHLEYVGESWAYYLGIGLPFGFGTAGWVLFSGGLFWFALSHRRDHDRRLAA